MCELLGMSSRYPTDINLSLHAFARHGGDTGPHSDGWGVAYAMGKDFRLIKEPQPAADSDCVRYIEQHHFESDLVISHIRRASEPKILSFENTHPFDRELAGRRFLLAHNGDLEGVENLLKEVPSRFTPLGDTDSEAIFCLLMNQLSIRVEEDGGYSASQMLGVIQTFASKLQALGKCNLLLSDSEYLYALGDNSLYWMTRTCEGNGLHQVTSKELGMNIRHEQTQDVALVATVPLTEHESWQPFQRGEVRVFRQGCAVDVTRPQPA